MNTEVTNTTAPVVGAESTQSSQQSDKAARFINRAEHQASKVMAEIEKLQKLANRKYYTYTPEQVNELFGAIQSSLDEAQASFTSGSPEKKKRFSFSA